MAVEQVGPTDSKKLKPYERRAKLPGESTEVVSYEPSHSEKLLEEMCRSFGSILEEAFIDSDSTHLTRLSRPVILTNPQTGERRLLQAQYTRFSPFSRDAERMAEVYRKNNPRAGRKSDETILGELYAELKKKGSPSLQITDDHFNLNVPLDRWREGFYFAVFKLFEGETVEQPEPFYVFESGMQGVGDFRNRRPNVHVNFYREPKFIARGLADPEEEIRGHLYFEWPREFEDHEVALKSASSLHPVTHKLLSSFSRPPWETYEIRSSEPVSRTMGFIQAYIRRLTVGTTL